MWPAVVAEWLRRLTRNQFPSGSAGSNPADCENFLFSFSHTCDTHTLLKYRNWQILALLNWWDKEKIFGDGGYRSPYLSHAKRALYHLSYVPISVQQQQIGQGVSAQHIGGGILFWRSLTANHSYLCVVILISYLTFDSSVGRAVDCSSTMSDIHRSLVQIRLEGIFVFGQLLPLLLWHGTSIIARSIKRPG